MVAKDLSSRSHHYALLIVVEAVLLGLYIATTSSAVRIIVAILTGVFYTLWGIYAHRDEIVTNRLVLEYSAVGILASLMLLSLAYTT